MKKLFIIVLLIALSIGLWRNSKAKNSQRPSSPTEVEGSRTVTLSPSAISESIFVPYWSLDIESLDDRYERVIYFGIAADEQGINEQESGYQNLANFDEKVKANQEKYLTLRLLNAETNLKLLSERELQQKIINETITIATAHDYDGIVLDLELSVLPVVDLSGKINTFVQDFYLKTKGTNIGFIVTMYGDTFYRNRPFDLAFIGKHSDEVMIMAYDFSKSYGEPGPNFPAQGREEYGYDFQKMIADFAAVVPIEKLSVIFGMYGYDWALGSQGKPLTRAEAITLNQLNQKYVNSCSAKDCLVTRDELSGEVTVSYLDDEGHKHSIWSEDEESVEKKIELIQGQFSGNIIYWAEGYF